MPLPSTTASRAGVRTADTVRAELARRQIPGRAMSTALGWSERTLRRRLAGEVEFTVSELTQVARFLDMSPADLLPAEPAA